MSIIRIIKNHESRVASIIFALALIALTLKVGLGVAESSTPLAGTLIGNQASASYTDALGVARTVTSNTVETMVIEKFGFVLSANNNKAVAPGGTVYFPHTIANAGNTSDSFKIKVSNLLGTGTTTNATCQIFADSDGDGQPDNLAAPLAIGDCSGSTGIEVASVGPVAAVQSYKFVVAVSTLSTAAADASATLKVDAGSLGDTTQSTSGYGGIVLAQNTDTLTVKTGAVFDVVKSQDILNAAPGDVVTYTFTVRNTGSTAGDTTLTDTIGLLATSSLSYKTGSGLWSSTATTALTDAAGNLEGGSADGTGTELDFGFSSNVVTAKFTNFAPNAVQTFSFKATVQSTAPAGTITNVAQFTCGSASCDTNTVQLLVAQNYSVTANVSATDGSKGVDSTPGTPASSDDETTIATAIAGSTQTFENFVWNKGNGSDAFVVSVSANTYPAGTIIEIFQADGATPLTASTTPLIPSNIDGAASTCTSPFIADNANKACGVKIVVKVTLPANATAGGSLTQLFTSKGDSTKKDAVKNTITTVTTANLTISNDAAGTLTGVASDLSVCTINSSSPSCTPQGSVVAGKARFPLWIKTSLAGTVHLDASGSDFVAGTLPAGWSVQFYSSTSSSCATLGAVSTNFTITASQVNVNTQIACAEVTAPVGASVGTTSFFFKATSGSVSSLSSTKRDGVEVVGSPNLTLSPSNTGQIAAGGSVVYSHILSNTGNNDLTCAMPVTGSNSNASFTSVVYADVNNNGVLDASELNNPVTNFTGLPSGALYTDGSSISTGTVAKGKSLRIFVKVFASTGASAGMVDTRLLTVTPAAACGVSAISVTDTSTIVTGNIRLLKTQALDASCSGNPASASFAITQLSAKPAQCVCYRVRANNEGSAAVTSVLISDSTPSYTKLSASVAPTCTNGTVGGISSNGSVGAVTCSTPTLEAGASATMQFCVKID